MNEMVTTIIVAVLGSNSLIEFIKWLIKRHDNDTPERIMLRALGEEKLGKMLRRWLHADERLADDWRIIENLYQGYTALGGNGEIKKLYLEASDLKTTE